MNNYRIVLPGIHYLLLALAVFYPLASEAKPKSKVRQAAISEEGVEAVYSFKRVKPNYGMLDWKQVKESDAHGLRLNRKSGKGGLGYHLALDLSGLESSTPVAELIIGQQNEAQSIRIVLADEDGTKSQYNFDLRGHPSGQMIMIPNEHGLSWTDPRNVKSEGKDGELDLAAIEQIQVLGDWKRKKVDLLISALSTVSDNADIAARREAYDKRLTAKAAAAAAAQQALVAERERMLDQGVDAQKDGPIINQVYAADTNLLVIEVLEGELEKKGQVDFKPKPNDELRETNNEQRVLAWKDGKPTMIPKGISVYRNGEFLGYYLEHVGKLTQVETFSGAPLTAETADSPRAYRIRSQTDSDFKEAVSPVVVSQKSKPIDQSYGPRESVVRHRIYLELPYSLKPGNTYQIAFPGLNTQQSVVDWTFNPKDSWTEVIHASQVGYRPTDPSKRATLSLWKGTGGAHAYDEWVGKPFYLISTDGGELLEAGTIGKALPLEKADEFRTKKNHAATTTYQLDFSDVEEPGVYRVFVPGLGVSYPFPIQEDAWLDAFSISMTGFLHHRSGIELVGDVTDYRRPLNFHPDMGIELLQSDVRTIDGEANAILDSMKRVGAETPRRPEAWGGYMDAGDWDRRSVHLYSTWQHLDLHELNPELFTEAKLLLPANEADNELPDILDEALWNLSFYKRLQDADGGVSGGVESTSHPRSGEASWQESLLVGVFEADALTSLRFAASAAKFARLAAPFNGDLANAYKEAAQKAWDYGMTHYETDIRSRAEANDDLGMRGMTEKKLRNELQVAKNLAALELYLTIEDEAYHKVFVETSAWEQGLTGVQDQRYASFLYARLPESLVNRKVQESLRQSIVGLADVALDFQAGNRYGIATDVPNLPIIGYVGYFSVPGMISATLPQAYFLTGDEKYLAGAVLAANFSAGANPDNMVYTTGVGQYSPQSPLHIDSRVTGQSAPTGITLYGQSDPSESLGYNDWMHVWHLKSMVPNSRDWPAVEAYVDVFQWPAMCEYTIHQTLGPTSYYWGLLAARK